MIDHFIIFTLTGSVLWKLPSKLVGNPIEQLIHNVLLENRSGEKTYTVGPYGMKWLFDNKLGIVMVVVYQKSLQLLYLEDLLQEVKRDFLQKYGKEIESCAAVDYAAEFKTIARDVQMNSRRNPKSQPRSFNTNKSSTSSSTISKSKTGKRDEVEQETSPEQDVKKDEFEELRKVQSKRTMRTGPRKFQGNSKKKSDKKGKESDGKKKMRKWEDSKLSKDEIMALDHSKEMTTEEEAASINEKRLAYIGEDEGSSDGEYSDSEDEDSDGVRSGSASDSTNSESGSNWNFQNSRIGSFFQQISGNKTLTREDLKTPMDVFKNQLIKKNVASEVAREICESVITSLVGKKLESFTRVSTMVKHEIESALLRILTPKKSTDVLREIQQAKSEGRTYSIVFVGVNGVGKSTSLSKVCYFLKSRGVKVMIAACDTFRSGAVEQLNQHAKVLDVPLFQKGYAKDPAAVARDAIRHAKETGYECVLVDTAGRMQNNEPLMRALAKLVSSNDPDLVLFVGEALVGNDGIDQLKLFNQALADYSDKKNPHTIDGCVLTKFDTIDDKVGAAVSMVYETGQPIMFVGTGQKYTNLRKLNARSVLKMLVE